MFYIISFFRSGTTYTSRLFRDVGINAGHEVIRPDLDVIPYRYRRNRSVEKIIEQGYYDGDVSGWGITVLDDLIKHKCRVAVQVRNPLDVVTSWMARGDILTHDWHGPALISELCPKYNPINDIDAVGMIWNAWAERVQGLDCYKYRVEDIETEWDNLIEYLGYPSAGKPDFGIDKGSANPDGAVLLSEFSDTVANDMYFLAKELGYDL